MFTGSTSYLGFNVEAAGVQCVVRQHAGISCGSACHQVPVFPHTQNAESSLQVVFSPPLFTYYNRDVLYTIPTLDIMMTSTTAVDEGAKHQENESF